MIELSGRVIELRPIADLTPQGKVLKLFEGESPPAEREHAAYLVQRDGPIPSGFDTYISIEGSFNPRLSDLGGAHIRLPASLGYLAPGDVIRVSPKGDRVRTLYRRSS